MQIYVYRQEGNLGPYTLEHLRAQLAAKAVTVEDLAWHEGLSEWQPVPSLLRASVQPASPPSLVPPGFSTEPTEPIDSSAERTRNKYLNHEASLRSLGALYYLGGIINSLIGVGMISAFFFVKQHQQPPIVLPCAILFLGLGGFLLWLAPQFRNLSRKAVIPGTVVASLGLIGIPIGTLINGYILYLIHSEKGKVVFSERYQRVIEATPHIRYKMSVIVKILFGVLIAFVALAVISVLIKVLTQS